ncbi:PAS domain S-box protein [Methanosarcina sp. KYL-1]|uniref:histidine kinase N-terminal 7TM domain-containing protein n=1 Tax=Methanosarcina sp. KYL-1 TaxID=2602068 RepID=UPI00210098E7|nr:histidine kinase N-terminal 7TM domain-containing protein [Methanosarcina sp. KYL-1]MCQ1537169.1 PAS domain S-box protein [Methanosarcina sp. KYL-1]
MGGLVFSAVVSVFLAYKANLVFDYRKVRFARYFILTMLCMADWSIFFAGELGYVDAKFKFFSTCLSYPGNAFVSTMWFLFAAEYCGVALKFIRRFEKAFFILPTLAVLAIFTNSFHWLYYSSYSLDTSVAFPIIIYDHGPLFWIIFVYFFSGTLLGILFFIRKFAYSGVYPIPQVGIVVGVLLPLIGTLLYLGDVGPFAFIDPTPFLFTITGLIIFQLYMRNEFLNLVPIARDNVIETMKDGYIVTDTEKRIIDVNPVVLELAGKTRDKALGRSLEELFEELIDFFPEDTDKGPFSREISITSGMGMRFFRTGFSSISSGENVRGALVVLHDITDAYRYGEALKQANQKLNLMSNITRHDLLNQVNVLSGYTELLCEMLPEDLRAEPRMERYLKNFKKGIETIHDQIIFTRDYQDLGVVAPVWQSVSGVAKEAAFSFSSRGIKFSIPDGGPEVFADPLLTKVFYNLFDNALAHGEKVSEIFVSFREEGGKAVIEVVDNGTGISMDMKDTIFEKSVGKNTGLGLFLIKSILSITDLEIKETGIEGEGARFEITVPPGNWRGSISQRQEARQPV